MRVEDCADAEGLLHIINLGTRLSVAPIPKIQQFVVFVIVLVLVLVLEKTMMLIRDYVFDYEHEHEHEF